MPHRVVSNGEKFQSTSWLRQLGHLRVWQPLTRCLDCHYSLRRGISVRAVRRCLVCLSPPSVCLPLFGVVPVCALPLFLLLLPHTSRPLIGLPPRRLLQILRLPLQERSVTPLPESVRSMPLALLWRNYQGRPLPQCCSVGLSR